MPGRARRPGGADPGGADPFAARVSAPSTSHRVRHERDLFDRHVGRRPRIAELGFRLVGLGVFPLRAQREFQTLERPAVGAESFEVFAEGPLGLCRTVGREQHVAEFLPDR